MIQAVSPDIKIFSTAPQSRDFDSASYGPRVADVARWSEAAGCEGILVYSDNGIVDPWLVSQLVVQATERLCPLVAVQPVYMHPYAVAKMVTTLANLHGRRTYLNLVAGGFRNDLLALGDETHHDERYARIAEYGRLIRDLTAGTGPVSVSGRYYAAHHLRLAPPVPAALRPGFMISGSSEAGLAAARTLGAIAVKYPRGAEEEEYVDAATPSGMRIGLIARETQEDAWRVAHERFPEDRSGQIAHHLAMRVSDSQWHSQLSALAGIAASGESPYWLGPFENYQTFCPYLVGDYQRVARELERYIGLGFRTFILDIPANEEELHHTGVVFAEATAASRT